MAAAAVLAPNVALIAPPLLVRLLNVAAVAFVVPLTIEGNVNVVVPLNVKVDAPQNDPLQLYWTWVFNPPGLPPEPPPPRVRMLNAHPKPALQIFSP